MSPLRTLTAAVFAFAAVIATGCNIQSPDVCTEAAEHLAQCQGTTANYTALAGSTCTGQAAAAATQALNSTCDSLTPSVGKADATSDPSGTGTAICIALAVPLFVINSVEEGAGCCFGYNCQRGLTCRGYRCRKPSKRGGPCTRAGNCEGRLVCINKKCATALDRGARCQAGQCRSPMVCGATGRCADRQPVGGKCKSPGHCAPFLVCGADNKCQERAATGGTCTSNRHCDFGTSCIAGKCQRRSSIGGKCDLNDKWDCDMRLECISGTCQARPDVGDACDRSQRGQCSRGNICWAGKCEPSHTTGEPCEGMFDCAFDYRCEKESYRDKRGTCVAWR